VRRNFAFVLHFVISDFDELERRLAVMDLSYQRPLRAGRPDWAKFFASLAIFWPVY
jgi:hypothetical protein